MKLYATTTSERASKGQGGKNLHIVVRNEKQEPCIALEVIVDATGRVQANMFTDITRATVKSQGTFLEDTKGEKKKGEDWCNECMSHGCKQL